MKPVLSYLDFREYLNDFYHEKKKVSGFSFRDFAKSAGFSSPVFIKLVIDGKANLAPSSITKLCNAMALTKDDRRYFKNLVIFGQAKTVEHKIQIFEKLKSFHSSVTVNELTDDQFQYFSKWYHPIIRELISMIHFDGDFKSLSELVKPQITELEARESVSLLEKLNLIEKDDDGQFRTTCKFLTTDTLKTGTLVIKNVQKAMSQLAAQAIETIPAENRDISGVSVSISEQSLAAIREELQKCRRRIFEIASEDKQCNSVFRVNLHLFPVSEKIPNSQLKSIQGGHDA
jgi:uncharacterized protein (TIGR02147 family)